MFDPHDDAREAPPAGPDTAPAVEPQVVLSDYPALPYGPQDMLSLCAAAAPNVALLAAIKAGTAR